MKWYQVGSKTLSGIKDIKWYRVVSQAPRGLKRYQEVAETSRGAKRYQRHQVVSSDQRHQVVSNGIKDTSLSVSSGIKDIKWYQRRQEVSNTSSGMWYQRHQVVSSGIKNIKWYQELSRGIRDIRGIRPGGVSSYQEHQEHYESTRALIKSSSFHMVIPLVVRLRAVSKISSYFCSAGEVR